MTENIGFPARDQIEAAQEIYKKMEYWQLQDKILIDHYLWLAGQYIALKKVPRKKLYYATQSQFENPDNKHLLDQLFPEKLLAHFPQKLLDELPK